MHQYSQVNIRSVTVLRDIEPRRYAQKTFDGRGLYLLLMPDGSRYWRYNYRFDGKLKTLALGIHPDISLENARARHQTARSLLANGIDPSRRKRALGKCLWDAAGPRTCFGEVSAISEKRILMSAATRAFD
jgi:hypothetical protein